MNSGIYIHIPFCVKKCNYCDFNSFDNINELKDSYVDTLIKEIESKKPDNYDTVFIGGGTPTSLPLPQLLKIVDLAAADNCEFTVEVNPATVNKDGFAALKNAGVNRISFGLQSAKDDELKLLGRIHTYKDFLYSYSDARKAGFENINIDVMFSLPNQTIQKFSHTLNVISDLSPEHISCYSLIIEEGTPFYEMPLELPSEDTDREMYIYCVNFLKSKGYNHYEISNFSKDGFECRHNIKYWNRTPYYGFGAGAHSLINNTRYENSYDVKQYVNKNKVSETILNIKDIKNEYVFLGLRMTNGINLSEYEKIFNEDFAEKHKRLILKYQYRNFCEIKDGRFFLTLDGISVSNTILSDFTE